MVIAAGIVVTVVAVIFVVGGFFAERRLRDRLEDLDARTRSGPRMIQMATLKRVEKAGRLPTLDKLLWRWFPKATSLRQKLLATGTTMTLGDFAFVSISLSVGVAFVLLQILAPMHRALSANLGDRTAAWLYDRLTDACVEPPGIGHLGRQCGGDPGVQLGVAAVGDRKRPHRPRIGRANHRHGGRRPAILDRQEAGR